MKIMMYFVLLIALAIFLLDLAIETTYWPIVSWLPRKEPGGYDAETRLGLHTLDQNEYLKTLILKMHKLYIAIYH